MSFRADEKDGFFFSLPSVALVRDNPENGNGGDDDDDDKVDGAVTDDDSGGVGGRLDVTPQAGVGWRWTRGRAEDESVDLKAVSGLQGCRSRCCLPSLWLSSV